MGEQTGELAEKQACGAGRDADKQCAETLAHERGVAALPAPSHGVFRVLGFDRLHSTECFNQQTLSSGIFFSRLTQLRLDRRRRDECKR